MTMGITAVVITNLVSVGIGMLLGVVLTHLHDYDNRD